MSGPCDECGGEVTIVYQDKRRGALGAFTVVCLACAYEMHVPAETTARTRIGALRRIVRDHSAARIDGYVVDATTASLLVSVYEGLSPANRELFGKPPLLRLVDLAWKACKPKGAAA